jgi:hypothetical protein
MRKKLSKLCEKFIEKVLGKTALRDKLFFGLKFSQYSRNFLIDFPAFSSTKPPKSRSHISNRNIEKLATNKFPIKQLFN